MTANASHVNQCQRPFFGTALEGLPVDSTPGCGSGGGEGLVSLMPRRVSQNRQGTPCNLGSDFQRARAFWYAGSSSTNLSAIDSASFTFRPLRVTKPGARLIIHPTCCSW